MLRFYNVLNGEFYTNKKTEKDYVIGIENEPLNNEQSGLANKILAWLNKKNKGWVMKYD